MIKKFLLYFLLTFSCFSVYAENVFSKGNLTSIASYLIQETPVPLDNDFATFVKETELADSKVNADFDALSTDQKYYVLDIVRKANLRKASTLQSKTEILINNAIEVVIQKLKQQGIFAGDLTDEDLIH